MSGTGVPAGQDARVVSLAPPLNSLPADQDDGFCLRQRAAAINDVVRAKMLARLDRQGRLSY